MTASTEILKGPVSEALKNQLADEIRAVKLFDVQEASHMMKLPEDQFRKLAKSIPSIQFGEGRKRWYSLADLIELVNRHKLPPLA